MDEILMGCKFLESKKNILICDWGEKHGEGLLEEETYRTNFRRQRDRILYTGGFRRLQDKTQVISAMKSGDHRTRLTHTLEVEQIAISISDALGLNSDLVSAIAMGHDVGHTPFGHAVERVLDKKLEGQGGFSHAVQSVKYLSEKIVKPENGKEVLKLQDLIFEGILKHDTDIYAGSYDSRQWDCDKYNLDSAGTLEMQVVYWADKLAYLTHDFEDFYNTNIYSNAKEYDDKLQAELQSIIANLIFEKKDEIMRDINSFKTRDLIRSVIAKLLEQSKMNIESNAKLNSKEMQNKTTSNVKEIECKMAREKDVPIERLERAYISKLKESKGGKQELSLIQKIKKEAYVDGLMINFDEKYREYYKELRELLNKRYIFSPEITRADAKAAKIATNLFEDFTKTPKLLPLNLQGRIPESTDPSETKCQVRRLVADYIASMTDRYAEVIYTDLNAIGGNYNY